jgi:hypothetical protein
MDSEADHAREYERLRAELADFVLDALAQRAAAGEQPQLSQALVEAIDRRVDQAVAARLSEVEWPDPDAFADQVIAAAGAHPSRDSEARPRSRTADDVRPSRRPTPARSFSPVQLWLLAIIGLMIVAGLTYYLLSRGGGGTQEKVVNNVTFVEPTPDGVNAQTPPANGAAPAPPPANETRRR